MQYTMAPFDIKKLILETVENQKKIAENKNLTIETTISDGDFIIEGDHDQITHAIRNVIDNSIKYTPEGGLTVSLSESKNNVLFSVKDTGVGVTQQDMASLFTAGGKGKNSIKINVESTGYGLFIVKQIVDTHKGKIWVESEGQGKGSTFFIELPKKQLKKS